MNRYDRLAQRPRLPKTRYNRWDRICRADLIRKEREHDRRARRVGFVDVAFEVEVYLSGTGGNGGPRVRSDGRHSTAPLGRYACIRIE